MRLNKVEQKLLKEATAHALGHQDFQLYLYGSRLDDNLNGGDIDLFLLLEERHKSLELKLKILVEIEKRLGERRVDLTLLPYSEKNQHEFFNRCEKEEI